MAEITNRLNAKAAAINIANILSSRDSKVRQNALIMLLNPTLRWLNDADGIGNDRQNAEPREIRITLDGNILIDGKKIDSEKPPLGYKIFVDKKEARS
ncbi:MAG: hypothetical protein ACOYEJ_04820 [Mahellales bacterium]|jgi:hypothetical protein